ncbi:hybrid sensor histidine kinase/response regulator [Bacteroidia bacterium]|nr:hybrid sensor histidine kinase/response regulator [Bacteroidia bacterium]
MNKLLIHTVCFLFFLLTAILPVKAGLPSISRFDKITQDEGLSGNHVLCLFQEKAGWMWIGTNLGLNRYDGYHFTVYKSDISESGSLKGELVRCIFEDRTGRLWVGTERGGLNLFNRDTEEFSHILFADGDTIFSVNSIIEDENNRILLGTDKGIAFLNKNDRLELFPVQALKQAGNPEVTKLFFDKRNNLWIGTLSGLFVYDFTMNIGEKLLLPETNIPDDEIHSLFFDSDNVLWIGTYHSGIYTVNIHSRAVRKMNSWLLSNRMETVRAIQEDGKGILWFGTRGGLVSYNKATQAYSYFLRDEDDGASLLSLCVDAKGDLWAGTRSGIYYRDADKQAFIYLSAMRNDNRFLNNAEIYCFYLNHTDLLIGTESGGINIYDWNTHRFRYLTTKEGLSSNCIKSFVRDGDEILVGTYQGGINILDANTYQVKAILRNQKDHPQSLKDDVVWDLMKDSRGNIWVATNKGIDTYDNKTQTFRNRTDIFPQKACNWISEDADGDLWLGGDELYMYSPQTGKVNRYEERTRDVISASDGKYWLATRGKGLALFDKQQGAIRYFSEADGLCNNSIQSLQRDRNGFIWISTFKGLSRFDETTFEFINFDTGDGLQDNQFNYGAAIAWGDELIYGGSNGVNIFNPSEVRRNDFVPPVVFTGLRIFNQPVKIGTVIKKSINRIDKIELNYRQNVFSIEFAALSYANPAKNQYTYMLEGFDKDWINAGASNSATYTNLDPGTYRFKVRGSNSNGIWNPKAATLEIIIHPPFWQTWWFRLALISLAALFLFYLAKFFIERAKEKNELVFEKTRARKLHEIENMKLRFFTNISHEIRTPLTLILGPLNQVLGQNSIDDDSRDKLQLVKKNADQLLKLINQLLDFRKIEAGKQEAHYEKSDLVFYIRSIVESFNGLATEKDIQLTFQSDRSHFVTWFDNDKIQKIVNNLLSNALKFTNNSGSVSVSFEVNDISSGENAEKQSSWSIIVKDTGKGISEKNLKKIFERFVQGDNGESLPGSGIGLSITREFVKLMGGEIDVESVEGEGASFTVQLPLLRETDVKAGETFPEKPENLTGAKQKIILIAEDNADVREYMISNFRQEYKILEAENGKEGFELAIQYVPDIIISDLLMPVMSGDAFCKKVKKDERTSHIPFILLTAVTAIESEKEALKAGVDDYITKPFDINILKLKVDNLLSLRNTLREKYRNDILLQPSPVTLVSPDEKFLKKAVDIIEKYIADPDFDIETFSSEVGVSRMQLYRKLEALTNMTVKEFIRDIRIKRAAQLLEQNKITVSEVIYHVGFRDMAYFRKCFREQYGASPSEYAAKFKQK